MARRKKQDETPLDLTEEMEEQSADQPTEFTVAMIKGNVATLLMADGRMFKAEMEDGVELEVGATIACTYESLDAEQVPVDAKVSA